MSGPAPLTVLAEARTEDEYGGKASQLAAAMQQGLPVPDGFALSWRTVDALVAADATTHTAIAAGVANHPAAPGPWAVRSSAIGEDSAGASFAGAHTTVLGSVGTESVLTAIQRVHRSATDPSAVAYRAKLGLPSSPRMGVVIQQMLDAEVAGVLFTRNPITGDRERLIEASWGLGETVVSGLVTPDQYRIAPTGEYLETVIGEKDMSLRLRPDGGVEEVEVDPDLVDACCLSEDHLTALHRLALACDHAFGSQDHDIEFAFAQGRLYLLQRRPITHG